MAIVPAECKVSCEPVLTGAKWAPVDILVDVRPQKKCMETIRPTLDTALDERPASSEVNRGFAVCSLVEALSSSSAVASDFADLPASTSSLNDRLSMHDDESQLEKIFRKYFKKTEEYLSGCAGPGFDVQRCGPS